MWCCCVGACWGNCWGSHKWMGLLSMSSSCVGMVGATLGEGAGEEVD